jgi:hypothetical protein
MLQLGTVSQNLGVGIRYILLGRRGVVTGQAYFSLGNEIQLRRIFPPGTTYEDVRLERIAIRQVHCVIGQSHNVGYMYPDLTIANELEEVLLVIQEASVGTNKEDVVPRLELCCFRMAIVPIRFFGAVLYLGEEAICNSPAKPMLVEEVSYRREAIIPDAWTEPGDESCLQQEFGYDLERRQPIGHHPAWPVTRLSDHPINLDPSGGIRTCYIPREFCSA